MNLSPRNRLLLVVGLMLAVLAALFVALVLPAIGRLSGVEDQIVAAEGDSNAAKLLLEQRTAIKGRAAAVDAQALELAVAVPENPDLPSTIIDLQDLAYESGVTLREVLPGELIIVADQPAVGVPVSLRVIGTWADTVDFLQQIRRMPRQMRVTDVTAERVIGTEAESTYAVVTSMEIVVYVIPAGSLDATVAAPPPAQ